MLRFCLMGFCLSASIIALSLHHALTTPTVPLEQSATYAARFKTLPSVSVSVSETTAPSRILGNSYITEVVRVDQTDRDSDSDSDKFSRLKFADSDLFKVPNFIRNPKN